MNFIFRQTHVTNLKQALQNHEFWPPYKHHIISIQYPSHKGLPEKSCLHCLRILIISWLFKNTVVIMKEIVPWQFFEDSINSGLAQLAMANQAVKNGLKASNKINCPNFSFCKILRKFSELIQSYDDVPFLGPEWPICPEQIFFKYKPLLLLSSTSWTFSLCKI